MMLRASNLPKVKHLTRVITSPHFIGNHDFILSILTMDMRRKKVLKNHIIDFSAFRQDSKKSDRIGLRGLIWETEKDIALVLISDKFTFISEIRPAFYLKITNFQSEELREIEPLSDLNTKELKGCGLDLEEIGKKHKTFNLDEALEFCLDPKTGLMKPSCLVSYNLASKVVDASNKKIENHLKCNIHGEMVLDPERGLSIVTTSDHIILYDRSSNQQYWKLAYRFEFLNGLYGGQKIAKYEKSLQKINIFGVCENSGYFNFLKEIRLRELQLPDKILYVLFFLSLLPPSLQ